MMNDSNGHHQQKSESKREFDKNDWALLVDISWNSHWRKYDPLSLENGQYMFYNFS